MTVAPRPVFFPSVGLQAMSALIHFFGLTIITHCISRRIQHESLTYQGIKTMPWPRLAVILMFCDSWLFLISSGLLVFGFGLELTKGVCVSAAYLCIFFYSTTKFFVYAFLAEKVHIVWSPTVGIRRLESPVYLTCIVSVSLYCIVMTLMLGGPIHENRENGACVIGLKPLASIPLLVYDLYINLFLTFMFLFPLFRSKVMSTTIRRLAIRTCLAAFIALTTSTINIVVIIVMKGRELGWVNLGTCGADVIVNAAAIFWVSGRKTGHQQSNSSGLPRERNRHIAISDPVFTSMNVESIAFPNTIHQDEPPSPDIEAPPTAPFTASAPFAPSASFPKYLEGKLEEGFRDSIKPPPSWFSRIFSRDRSRRNQPQVQISVSRECELQTSQIELQPRTDSNSDIVLPEACKKAGR